MPRNDIELKGMKELTVQLNRLERNLAIRTLRKAVRRASKPVLSQMRGRAPRGARPHKTYKGRSVQPGFLKRSLRYRIKLDRRKGSLVVTYGVLAEAFYGIAFLDQGPFTVSARRRAVKNRSNRRARVRNIRPYRIEQRPPGGWFESTFVRNTRNQINNLRDSIADEIRKVTRGNNAR